VAGTTQAETIACADAHPWESMGVPRLSDPSGAPYAIDAVAAEAEQACSDTFAAYVGRPLDGSTLSATAFHPTMDDWDRNERRVACLVVDPAGTVKGSLKGANR